MSTIFGVIVIKNENRLLNSEDVIENSLLESIKCKGESEYEVIEVLYRGAIFDKNELFLRTLNPLLFFLPLNTKLVALDNSQQGIETVEDFLKKYEN
jgi:hypothetical protein